MKHFLRLAAVASLVSASALSAQARTSGINVNLAAGASFPTGDFGQGADVGYALAAGIGGRQLGSPIGWRIEGMYNSWNLSRFNTNTHTTAGTANATWELGSPTSGAGNSLYAIGGLGVYGSGGGSNIGWNLGGGFRFPLSQMSAYFEARYHAVSDQNRKFVPVVFGLVF